MSAMGKGELRGLTLHQPWASAIVDGPKRVENREWAPSKRLVETGLFIALHAGKTLDQHAATDLAEDEEWPTAPRRARDYPLGVILGVVQVIEVVNLEHDPAHPIALDPWAMGTWCWRLASVWRLSKPIKWKGAQGLWPVSRELGALIRSRAIRPGEDAPAAAAKVALNGELPL